MKNVDEKVKDIAKQGVGFTIGWFLMSALFSLFTPRK